MRSYKSKVIQIIILFTIVLSIGFVGPYEPVKAQEQIPDTFDWITQEIEDEKDDKFKVQHDVTNDLISDVCIVVRIICIGLILIGGLIIAITLVLASRSDAVANVKERIFRHFIGSVLYFAIPTLLAIISTVAKDIVGSIT